MLPADAVDMMLSRCHYFSLLLTPLPCLLAFFADMPRRLPPR